MDIIVLLPRLPRLIHGWFLDEGRLVLGNPELCRVCMFVCFYTKKIFPGEAGPWSRWLTMD